MIGKHGTPDAGPNSVNARERAAAGYRKSRVEKGADLFVFVFQTLPAIVVVAGLLVVAVVYWVVSWLVKLVF